MEPDQDRKGRHRKQGKGGWLRLYRENLEINCYLLSCLTYLLTPCYYLLIDRTEEMRPPIPGSGTAPLREYDMSMQRRTFDATQLP